MLIAVLGSGSTGNATLVASGRTTILLEAGLSARQIALRARACGFDPDRVSAVFVSHAHADHIVGAPVFTRRHRVPAFLTDAAFEDWLAAASRRPLRRIRRWFARDEGEDGPAGSEALGRGTTAARRGGSEGRDESASNARDGVSETRSGGPPEARRGVSEGEPGGASEARDRVSEREPEGASEAGGRGRSKAGGGEARERDPRREAFRGPKGFYHRMRIEESDTVEVGTMRVRVFPVPHDAQATIGYVVEAEGMRFGYVTDLGHVTGLVSQRLKGCDALLIEMNHDPDLLRTGPYPWSVKQRIASRHGHLSNEQGALLVEHALGSDTRFILLGHVSEVNNEPAMAMASARLAVERAGRGDILVVPAEAHRPSRLLRL